MGKSETVALKLLVIHFCLVYRYLSIFFSPFLGNIMPRITNRKLASRKNYLISAQAASEGYRKYREDQQENVHESFEVSQIADTSHSYIKKSNFAPISLLKAWKGRDDYWRKRREERNDLLTRNKQKTENRWTRLVVLKNVCYLLFIDINREN